MKNLKTKIENWLSIAPMWKVYIFMVVMMFTMSFTIFMLMELLLMNGEPFMDVVKMNLMLSSVMGIVISYVPYIFISQSRTADKYFEIAKPIMERAESCQTKNDWNKVQKDVINFYQNHPLGKFNRTYINKINEVLRIKRSYMK